MRSLWIAVAMYSKLPVPQVEWDRKSLSWALCFFQWWGGDRSASGVVAGAVRTVGYRTLAPGRWGVAAARGGERGHPLGRLL